MCMVTGALLEQATLSGRRRRRVGSATRARVVSALWIVGDVHRMGVLAIHVAQATLRRYPEPVLPVTVRPVFARMGRIGEQLAGHTATALRAGNVALA